MIATVSRQMVAPGQRFRASDPCPICGGFQRGGHGSHCYGYYSEDRTIAYCTETPNDTGQQNRAGAYAHRLDQTTRAGDGSPSAETSTAPRTASKKRTLYPNIRTMFADGWRETARYLYENPDTGQRHYRVRYDPPTPSAGRKRFYPWQQLEGGKWVMDEQGIDRVLYRLAELRAAPAHRTVFIPEGEKCTDALAALGLVATCSPGGAKAWHLTPGAAEELRGRHVVIPTDNDADGRAYAAAIAEALQGIAASVRILYLPGLAEHGDVYDWIDAGGTKDDLYELVIATPTYDAAATAGNAEQQEQAVDATERIQTLELRVREFEQREKRKADSRLIWDLPGDAFIPSRKSLLETILSMEDAERKRGRETDQDDVWLSLEDAYSRETGALVAKGIISTSGLPETTVYTGRRWLKKTGLLHERQEHYQRDGKIHTRTHFRIDRDLLAEFSAHPEHIEPILMERGVPISRRGGNRRTCSECGETKRILVEHLVTRCTCLNCHHTWEETATPAQPESSTTATNPEFNLSHHYGDLLNTEEGHHNGDSGIFPELQLIEAHQHCGTCGSSRTYRVADDAPATVRCWDCEPRPLHTATPATAPTRQAERPETPATPCQQNPDGGWHEYARLRNVQRQLLCVHCEQPMSEATVAG